MRSPLFKTDTLFWTGLLLTGLGLLVPFVEAREVLYSWDFRYGNLVSLPYLVMAVFLVLILLWKFKRHNLLVVAAIANLIIILSVVFMKTQWKPSPKIKFYLDFFQFAGAGWWISSVGAVLVLFSVVAWTPDRKRAPYLFLLPMLLGISFLTFFPAFFALFISFRRWNILVPRKPFVGFDNFARAFTDEYFLKSIWISFKYALGVIPAKIIIAFFFALLIYTIPKFKGFFRVIYFLPVVTSVVAVSVIWNWIYHPYYGIANYILSFFGVEPVDWLGNPDLAIWSVAVVSVWRSVGYNIIIFLAGLNDIPKNVLEASEIDGASRWQKLRYIMMPLMKPSLVFVFITSTIGAIQVFSEIYMMTGGNADTKTAVYYIWEYGFRRLQMGYASAMSLILFMIILTITLVQMRVTRMFKED